MSSDDSFRCDMHTVTAIDISPADKSLPASVHDRDCVQRLMNKVCSLEREATDEGIAAKLPDVQQDAAFRLPRAMPLPKSKPKTRWEKFAEEKGIQRRKRGALVYDDVSDKWLPRWGAKSIKKEEDKRDWVRETGSASDPWAQTSAEKKLQQTKQKVRELRNKVEAGGGSMAGVVSFMGNDSKNRKRGKEKLERVIKTAQKSSASQGRFDRKTVGEGHAEKMKVKRAHHASAKEDAAQALRVLDRMERASTAPKKPKDMRDGEHLVKSGKSKGSTAGKVKNSKSAGKRARAGKPKAKK